MGYLAWELIEDLANPKRKTKDIIEMPFVFGARFKKV